MTAEAIVEAAHLKCVAQREAMGSEDVDDAVNARPMRGCGKLPNAAAVE
jgi:hypothetical protein